ncbi:M48 family metallopeptidase [Ottowia sp.]|uniref:M48 family metallopeptidase n=2 Tax=Ottowia sp. TaxID=1898956 RepID=UPI00345EF6CB
MARGTPAPGGMRQLVLDLFGLGGAAPQSSEQNPPPAQEQRARAAPENVAVDEGGTESAPAALAPAAPAEPLESVLAPAAFSHPRANRRIAFAGACVAYEFKRGRRRTIGFVVGAEGLTVSAPRWTPVAEVEAALHEKARWIVAKLGEARERQQRIEAARIVWEDGAEFSYLGEPVLLVLDPRQRHGPAGCVLVEAEALPGVARRALHVGLPHHASQAQLRDAVQAWLMRQARRLFTQRLDHFAPQLGVRWHKLSLSSASTRWGSASADGSIRLNWRLVHFRQAVIDYVVVHELAHLQEMNHGPRFWQQVEAVLPDYAERRGELRDEAVPRW